MRDVVDVVCVYFTRFALTLLSKNSYITSIPFFTTYLTH